MALETKAQYKCTKCGKKTEWDEALGSPLCVDCWDRVSGELIEEKVAAAHRAYREKNPEKVAAAHRAWYDKNKEKVAAAQRAYREKNPEKVAAAQLKQ